MAVRDVHMEGDKQTQLNSIWNNRIRGVRILEICIRGLSASARLKSADNPELQFSRLRIMRIRRQSQAIPGRGGFLEEQNLREFREILF